MSTSGTSRACSTWGVGWREGCAGAVATTGENTGEKLMKSSMARSMTSGTGEAGLGAMEARGTEVRSILGAMKSLRVWQR